MSRTNLPKPPSPTLASSSIASSSIEALLGSITDIIHYSVQKTRHECSLVLQEQRRRLLEADFQAEAKTSLELTLLLTKCKTKLQCLEIEIAAYPEVTRDVWDPLVNDLKARIADLRKKRKQMG